MITKYSDIYFLDLVRLVEKFHKDYLSDRFHPCDVDVVINTIKENSDDTFLLIKDSKCVGVIAGVRIKSKFNNEIFFQEIMWHIQKPYGRYAVSFIREVEKILKSSGVSTIIMSVLERPKNQKIKRVYSKMGYMLEEAHYMRAL